MTIKRKPRTETYTARATERWKGAMPDWIETLAELCDASPDLYVVADKTGLRPDVISGLIGKTYPGRLDRVEATVRGALMASVVACPAHGFEIGRDACASNQNAKFGTGSRMSAKFPRACKSCPNKIGGK